MPRVSVVGLKTSISRSVRTRSCNSVTLGYDERGVESDHRPPLGHIMQMLVAKNFNDYVAVMAANSPHSLVMDWWRRLDFALRDYGCDLRPMVDHRNRDAIEKAVSQDQTLGPGVTASIRELRQLRNRVAHESVYLSSEDATARARQAFSLIAALARRVSELEDLP